MASIPNPTTMSVIKTTSASPFKSLPPELRNRIYEAYHAERHPALLIEVLTMADYMPNPALTCVDRQIRSESLQYFRDALQAFSDAGHMPHIDTSTHPPHELDTEDSSPRSKPLTAMPPTDTIRLLRNPQLQSLRSITCTIRVPFSEINWAFSFPLILTMGTDAAQTIGVRVKRDENVPNFLSGQDVCDSMSVVMKQGKFGLVKQIGNEGVLDVVSCVRLTRALGEEVRATMVGLWQF